MSVFFIMSGFLMFYSYGESDKIQEKGVIYNIKFGIYKVKKLYQLHIITLFAAMPFLIYTCIGNHIIGEILKSILKTVSNALLIQAWVPNTEFYFSLNGVSWYLSVTLFLYIMFPFILKVIKRYSGIKTAFLVVICTFVIQIVMSYLSYRLQINHQVADIIYDDVFFVRWFSYICPLSRLEDFIIGCNLGYIFTHMRRDREQSWKYTMFELGIIGIIIVQWILYVLVDTIPSIEDASIHAKNWWGYTAYWTMTSCVLIYIFAMKSGKISKLLTNRVLVFVGNMSASAFLIHQIVFRYLISIEKIIFGAEYKYFNLIICLAITIGCSYLWGLIIKTIQKKKYELKT